MSVSQSKPIIKVTATRVCHAVTSEICRSGVYMFFKFFYFIPQIYIISAHVRRPHVNSSLTFIPHIESEQCDFMFMDTLQCVGGARAVTAALELNRAPALIRPEEHETPSVPPETTFGRSTKSSGVCGPGVVSTRPRRNIFREGKVAGRPSTSQKVTQLLPFCVGYLDLF